MNVVSTGKLPTKILISNPRQSTENPEIGHWSPMLPLMPFGIKQSCAKTGNNSRNALMDPDVFLHTVQKKCDRTLSTTVQ
jgi:hypothetical protein